MDVSPTLNDMEKMCSAMFGLGNHTTLELTCAKSSEGNILPIKEEIFVQRRKLDHTHYEDRVFTSFPSFSLLKVKSEGTENVIMQNRLIPTSIVYDVIVLIPTIARFDGDGKSIDYVDQVLHEYRLQLQDMKIKKNILIIVTAFSDSKHHKIFAEITDKYKDVKEMVFFIPPLRFKDPYADIEGVHYASPYNAYPGKLARQQSCDVIFLSDFIHKTFQYKYLIYSEDDFVPCPVAISSIFETMDNIESYHANHTQFPEWEKGFCSLKLTVGLGGFLLSREVVPNFIDFSVNNIDVAPIDILILFVVYHDRSLGYPICTHLGLTSYVTRTSFFRHIGSISNWRERNDKVVFGARDYGCSFQQTGDWALGRTNHVSEMSRQCNHHSTIPCLKL